MKNRNKNIADYHRKISKRILWKCTSKEDEFTWSKATTTRVSPHCNAIVEIVVDGGGGPIVTEDADDILSDIEIVSTILQLGIRISTTQAEMDLLELVLG